MCDDLWPVEGEKVDLDGDKIYSLGWGLIYRVVCSPKKHSNETISDCVSFNDNPGTSVGRWEVTSDEGAKSHPNWSEASGSEEARAQCPDHPERHHVLMNC